MDVGRRYATHPQASFPYFRDRLKGLSGIEVNPQTADFLDVHRIRTEFTVLSDTYRHELNALVVRGLDELCVEAELLGSELHVLSVGIFDRPYPSGSLGVPEYFVQGMYNRCGRPRSR